MNDELLKQLPLLTAIATLTAAGVAAATALLVALINTRSNRRLALESAHRQYRQELTSRSIETHREFLSRFNRLFLEVSKTGAGIEVVSAFLDTSRELGREYVSAVTGDETFDRATRVAADGRLKVFNGLMTNGVDWPSTEFEKSFEFLLDWIKRLDRSAAAMQKAAEGFVFESKDAQQIAGGILDTLEHEIDNLTWFGEPKIDPP